MTPGSAVSLVSTVRYVTDCATWFFTLDVKKTFITTKAFNFDISFEQNIVTFTSGVSYAPLLPAL